MMQLGAILLKPQIEGGPLPPRHWGGGGRAKSSSHAPADVVMRRAAAARVSDRARFVVAFVKTAAAAAVRVWMDGRMDRNETKALHVSARL